MISTCLIANSRRLTGLLLASAALVGVQPAFAQSEAETDTEATDRASFVDNGDIVVSARKRQESILKVPVVVTAISDEKLEKLGVTEMTDLPRLVPGLNLARGNLSGGIFVTIRGIGTSQQDPSLDQSVSLNVDGLPLTQGLAFASGMFDLGQIEVMKGPQALFYGKASPGGVISLRSADPTDQLEVMGRVGYEFEGREKRGELIVSGPLSDTLKARLAGNYASGKGYFRHVGEAVPGTGAVTPAQKRDSNSKSYHVRGTLLWNPTDRFSARLKANLVRDRIIRPEAYQLVSCPNGPGETIPPANLPFIQNDDCKLNRTVAVVDMDPAVFVGTPDGGMPNGGVGFGRTRQHYGSLEMSYDLTPELSLDSTTAYYKMRSRSLFNAHGSSGAGPVLAASNRFGRRDFTQELRLNSDFAGPLNFTLGGFYQDASLLDGVQIQGNRAYGLDFLDANGQSIVDTKVYSLFGQARWKISSQLELAGGVRWTDEAKSQDVYDFVAKVPRSVAVDRRSQSNFSPEATLTYTPTDDLTVFAALKQAYKSGGFSVATPPLPGADNSFGDEKVRGGEIGVKTRLFDRQLTANIAGYYYKYTGLQVGGIEPPRNGQPIIRTINAGGAKTYGIDFDAAFRPHSVEGLELNASINWNKGTYTELDNIPCWSGQTVALGCIGTPNSETGLNTTQDISGTPLIRAPQWQATFGFSYEMPVASDYKLVLTNSNQYSSRFVTFLATGRPNRDNYQGSFLKSDLSLALRSPEDRWELAVLGKNITDKVTSGLCATGNYAGGLFLAEQITGGSSSGAGGIGQVSCYAERGRSVWLRLTVRPFN